MGEAVAAAEMLDQYIDATILYPLVVILFIGSAELGVRLGLRLRGNANRPEHMGTLSVSALGLLALLLAFSLSHALSRYETRRELIVEEANAIGATAHLAAMLPEEAQEPILSTLREYAAVRTSLGFPFDPMKLERDGSRSVDLLTTLWREAAAVAQPQSLNAHRFINALEDMTKVQERRLAAHRYHVPDAAYLMLVGMAIVALGFTGYQAGLTGTRLRGANVLMSVMVAIVTVLVVDLDQPARGFIQLPTQPLAEVAKGI
ncbi:MAG TPA: hypothetical protein VEU06_02540 [Micropepsaceae bacterium]|nr:hypothetical protein [Micropepsaceae bacterium]